MAFESSPSPYPVLRVSKDALWNNLNIIRAHAAKEKAGSRVKVLIPVKANAYGCGLDTIMPFFQEAKVDSLGVANIKEAETCRKLGWKKEILNLGSFYPENSEKLFRHNITVTITGIEQVSLLKAVGPG